MTQPFAGYSHTAQSKTTKKSCKYEDYIWFIIILKFLLKCWICNFDRLTFNLTCLSFFDFTWKWEWMKKDWNQYGFLGGLHADIISTKKLFCAFFRNYFLMFHSYDWILMQNLKCSIIQSMPLHAGLYQCIEM